MTYKKENIEELEKYLMKEADTSIEGIKEAYKDRLFDHESYEEWLYETAKANGYVVEK
jgi:hypothetical protein